MKDTIMREFHYVIKDAQEIHARPAALFIILYSGHLIYKSGLPVLSCVLKRMIMLHAWRCLRTFLQALFLLFWLK